MDAIIYNQQGKESERFPLPEEFFALPWNADLVHQVVTVMAANGRQNSAYAKDRSAVSGGGAKPWRQKGTGRARHGSSRSPIWSGGGVTHGPTRLRDYRRNLTKKMRAKALFTLLSQKWRDNEILLAQRPELSEPKTKTAQTFIDKLAAIPGFAPLNYRTGKRALFIYAEDGDAIRRSFANIPQVAVALARDVSLLDVINYRFIVLLEPAKIVDALSVRARHQGSATKPPAKKTLTAVK
ncbi:MAG: 50S ribosomal protein L4 [Candidatus Paceibacterota bacterium]